MKRIPSIGAILLLIFVMAGLTARCEAPVPAGDDDDSSQDDDDSSHSDDDSAS
tara:strand:+ start:317 stop:475 length:159 start_codon:yes stop_codon:yes gene_type:complete